MKIKFWKMHGAKNDFIFFDNRSGTLPVDDSAFIERIATRRSGIGADGVLFIEKSDSADFSMHFFNSDGKEAEMCGNAARCVARLAFDLGVAGENMTIETAAGQIQAEVLGDLIRLHMIEPFGWKLDGSLELGVRHITYGFVNTGVPHAVMRTGDLKEVDVQEMGSAIRYHTNFAPDGTNANFVQLLEDGDILIRTYERGVEDETLACGTGITASALIAAKNGWVDLPVTVHTCSGDKLSVDGELTENGACNVTLSGPAEYVCEGLIGYGDDPTVSFGGKNESGFFARFKRR